MAKMLLNEVIEHLNDPAHNWDCVKCKLEPKQLLAWLKELRSLRSVKEVENSATYVYGDVNRDEDNAWHYCSHCRAPVDISYSDYECRGRKIREAFGNYCSCCGYKMGEIE